MKPTLHAIALAFSLTLAVSPVFAQDTASITQNGTDNLASITQAGNHGANDAAIVQDASSSSASINQANVGNSSAAISQAGVELEAAIDQHDSEAVTARITQEMDGFKASVLQAGSSHSDVSIAQSGQHLEGEVNVKVLNSENTSVVVDAVGIAFAEINQSNVVNGSIHLETASILTHANINQHDASNVTTRVGQGGLELFADIEQAGEGGTIITEQGGTGNSLNVVQDGGFGGAGLGSLVSITQDGGNNNAGVTQVGRGFTATIAQAGSGNTATINQHY